MLPEPALAKLPGGRERLVEECVCAAQRALYRFTSLKKADAEEPAEYDHDDAEEDLRRDTGKPVVQ